VEDLPGHVETTGSKTAFDALLDPADEKDEKKE